MSIKEFTKLSRQNNYTVTKGASLLPSGTTLSFDDLIKANKTKTLYIKRNSKIVALIPLTKKHNIAEFTSHKPKVSKTEFNLINEFTNVA